MKNDKLIEQLKKKYENKSLKEVEKSIDSFNTKSHESRKSFIFGFYYLRFSTRYKEDKRYKATSFETYALERHNIRPTTFRNEVKIFNRYDKEAKALGIGVIRKIEEKCTPKKTPSVLRQIAAIEKEVKRPLDRQQIDSVIWDNRKPDTEKKAETGPTKAEYRLDLNRVKLESIDKDKLIGEQADQIDKLQKTVIAKDEMVAEYAASYASLLKQYEKLALEHGAMKKAADPLAGFFKSNSFKSGGDPGPVARV
ncbi:hypothetical protein LCGC14_1432070 [marine sediment metagenome]|uniref:Uncharacterized protein n=1 Tax=marine sediment metagenome TaxID=412755 RepID=A0A0F9JNC7_9ZZZZ